MMQEAILQRIQKNTFKALIDAQKNGTATKNDYVTIILDHINKIKETGILQAIK